MWSSVRIMMVLWTTVVACAATGAAATTPADGRALSRALLLAAGEDRVRVVTHDGLALEGRLSTTAGDTIEVASGRGSSLQRHKLAVSDIAQVSVRSTPDQEAMRIGGFLGGFVAGVIGFALDDVNTVYTTAGGSLLGYGVGYALRGTAATWKELYPEPPPQEFRRRGWFVDGTVAMGNADGDVIEEWFLAGGAGLGVTVAPDVALSLTSSSWIETGIFDSWTDGAYDVLTRFGLSAYYTPGVGPVLGIGAGAAVAEHNTAADESSVADWGWGAGAMAAYVFRIGKTTLIGPMVGVDYLAFDGDYFDDVTVFTFGLRLATY